MLGPWWGLGSGVLGGSLVVGAWVPKNWGGQILVWENFVNLDFVKVLKIEFAKMKGLKNERVKFEDSILNLLRKWKLMEYSIQAWGRGGDIDKNEVTDG